jgi:hypothetical protein
MPIQSVWFTYERPWGYGGFIGTWSDDVDISPSTVYAFTAVQAFLDFDSDNYVFSGIASYRTRDPKSGKHTTHDVGKNQTNGEVPAIYDDNVDSVTFLWGLGADGTFTADVSFQIFMWG